VTSTTTAFVYEDDLATRARNDLLQQWWTKERFVAFARALGYGAQVQEDASFDVLVSTTLDLATGDALDQWGDTVGEYRQGLLDGPYRNFIKARILANRSSGKLDELIELATIVTAPSNVVTKELFPKHVTIYALRQNFMDDLWRTRVHNLMMAVKPAGTALALIEVQPKHFGFAASPAFGFDVGGFARLV